MATSGNDAAMQEAVRGNEGQLEGLLEAGLAQVPGNGGDRFLGVPPGYAGILARIGRNVFRQAPPPSPGSGRSTEANNEDEEEPF